MVTSADIGYGTIIAYGDGGSPESFTDFSEILAIMLPGDEREFVDATHMASLNRFREFIEGLRDGGEAGFNFNFVPGSGSDSAMQTIRASSGARNYRITFANNTVWTFAALLQSYKPNDVTVDGKMEASVTLKVTASYSVS